MLNRKMGCHEHFNKIQTFFIQVMIHPIYISREKLNYTLKVAYITQF